MQGVVREDSLREIRRRIQKIDSAAVQSLGQLQQHIEDCPFAILPQMMLTERPDRAASCLLDGQIVILMDNSPYALVAPATVFHLLHASDDNFQRWQYGTFLRLIRLSNSFFRIFAGVLCCGNAVSSPSHSTALLTAIAESRAQRALYNSYGSSYYGNLLRFDQRGQYAHSLSNRFGDRDCGWIDSRTGGSFGIDHQSHCHYRDRAYRAGKFCHSKLRIYDRRDDLSPHSHFRRSADGIVRPCSGHLSDPVSSVFHAFSGGSVSLPHFSYRRHNPDIVLRFPCGCKSAFYFLPGTKAGCTRKETTNHEIESTSTLRARSIDRSSHRTSVFRTFHRHAPNPECWLDSSTGWSCFVPPLAWLGDRFIKAHPPRPVSDSLEESAGAALTRLLAVVLCLMLLYDFAAVMRLNNNSASYVALSNVSAVFQVLPVVLVMLFSAWKNGQTAGSAALLWMRLFPFLFVISLILQWTSLQPRWLLPVLGPGLRQLGKGTLSAAGWIAPIAAAWLASEPGKGDLRKNLPLSRAVFFIGAAASVFLALLAMMSPADVFGNPTRSFQFDKLLSNGRVASDVTAAHDAFVV